MKAHEIAAARRALLDRWRALLGEADSMHEERGAQHSHRVLRLPSCDMMRFLREGLDAVAAGKPDPFGIKAKGGARSRLSRDEWIGVVAEVIASIDDVPGRNQTDREAEAIALVAERHGLTEESLRKRFYDADTRGWARLRVDFDARRGATRTAATPAKKRK
jgi:hypothetical protein